MDLTKKESVAEAGNIWEIDSDEWRDDSDEENEQEEAAENDFGEHTLHCGECDFKVGFLIRG